MKQPKAAPNQRAEWPEVRLPVFPDRTVRITDYGAIAGGMVMNTKAFARAIEACATAGGGTVRVPAGLWLTGPIQLQSGIDLHLEKGAIVLFSPRFEDYPPVRTIYEGRDGVRCTSPVSARSCENIALTGEGIFDGSGQAWRPVKRFKLTDQQWKALVASGGVVDETGKMWWPSAAALNGQRFLEELEKRRGKDSLEEYAAAAEYLRPVLVSLVECRRILLDGPTFQNSPSWCLHPLLCEDLTIRRVDVRNPWWAQNGDALDLDSCRNVVVADSTFDAGDDAICLKSGKDEAGRKRGRPTENVMVTGCVVYHGHGGFVIGSEMSGGVRNVRVSDCAFFGTDTGLRFKSTRGRGGVVENIRISGISMIGIKEEAITFSSYYGIKDQEAEMVEVDEGTPTFRDFHLKNIVCHGAKRAARSRACRRCRSRTSIWKTPSLRRRPVSA